MDNSKKITKQEFEKWGQEFQDVATTALLYGRKERLILQITGFGSLPTSDLCIEELIKSEAEFTKKGNIEALLTGLYNLEREPKANKTKKRRKLGGLSLNEWIDRIKKRLEEHFQAGGYYDPTKPPDLSALLAKRKKFEEWEKDKEYFSNLYSCMNAESLKIMIDIVEFNSQFKALTKYKDGGLEKSEKESSKKEKEDFIKKYRFYFEDFLGRLEEAEQIWEEQKKKNDNPPLPLPPVPSPTPSPTPTPPPGPSNPSPLPKSNTPTDQERIEKIEKEKVQLEKQIKEIKKQQLNQQLDPAEKVEQKNLLEKMKKKYQDLETKQVDLEKLKRQSQARSENKDLFYLPWVISSGCLLIIVIWGLNQLRNKKRS